MRFLIKRRELLLGLGTLTSTVPFACANRFKNYNQVKAPYSPKRRFSVVGNTSLRKRAALKGLIYGAFPSFGYENLSKNKQLQSAFIRECGLLVGGFYWGVTRPSINHFNFHDTDSFAQFASEHGMLFRGHPLVWHQVIPDWLTSKFQDQKTTSKEIENILTNHVSTIVKRYAGRIHSWDVVNEAIEPKHGRPDNLQNTPWLKFLGPDYIDIAFRTARDADPKALLVYNDALLDHDIPEHEARRIATLKLLETLKSKGTPVQALGIQAHLFADKPFNPKKLRAFLRDVASLGLKILITELDVADNDLPKDIDVRDRMVASVYEDYLSVVLNEPAVIAVISWGFTDSDTWLSRFPRSDRAPLRPLPFDFNLKPKLAWNAMARAFDKAPKR
ncbi:glycosyl hydrolase family 10 [Brasilonema octagenarum UFV-E1]|uniref:Beta-xylanase n=2 Tax=Brasilonema TaxID=383614 RepID=A0A856M7Z1_9CYAN|nr:MULTISPECIES: endo-1,4-beta-xylanase [Brasilonema]NMF62093.1 glycosyl hydrolase family 10 [Brasilonema octagenarum UFV-OR1]QDL06520.1 glycosyl hydrolase family 10 [Brasilonema sennae CENA114]QDL12891.1 glycosyl hydrolase family 10 [Brasilonema octagenarum UFV-E1]